MPGKQDLIRKDNIIDIVNVLRESSCYAANIAKQIQLSPVAVSKIVSVMKDIGIIIEDGCIESTCGRKPTLLRLNPEFAVVAVVVMSESACKIFFTAITGQILKRIEFEDTNLHISQAKIKLIAKTIEEYLSSTRSKLLSIAFTISGKVNSKTGELIYANKIEDYRDTNLKTMFESLFSVPVIVANDVNLAIEGELNYSSHKKIMANTLYLYIDKGTGSALMLDGKIVHGSSGLAGEIGLFNLSPFGSAFDNEKIKICNNYVALNAMANMYDARVNNSEYQFNYDRNDEDMEKFFELYENGDKLANEVVSKSAKCLGALICSLAEFLNFDNVLVSGGVKRLGDKYIKEVSSSANNKDTFMKVDICFAELDKEAVVLGAINRAIAVGLKNYVINF